MDSYSELFEAKSIEDFLYHKAKVVLKDSDEYTGILDFYESEYDSGYGVPCFGFDNGMYYPENDIKSIEIID